MVFHKNRMDHISLMFAIETGPICPCLWHHYHLNESKLPENMRPESTQKRLLSLTQQQCHHSHPLAPSLFPVCWWEQQCWKERLYLQIENGDLILWGDITLSVFMEAFILRPDPYFTSACWVEVKRRLKERRAERRQEDERVTCWGPELSLE